jgi:hypothetical protein
MDKTLTFIKNAKNVHGDKYDYSKVEYKNCESKVCIICPEHGEFWQTPYKHINKHQGCPECNPKKKKTYADFIELAKKKHGDKYDYSKVKNTYKNITTKVCIICPEHGEFWQTPNVHIKCNCPKCVGKNVTNFDFITKSNSIHNGKYDYSKVEYINSQTKVCIICPEHGEFWQTPNEHLHGCGCPKCVGKNKSTEDWINEANKIHNNRYDYSKVEYITAREKVCIICPEHGEFWQTSNLHLNGCGCPKCNSSKLENEVYKEFPKFEREKKFDWLKYKRNLRLDFFDNELNIAIECQGEQHFLNRGIYKNLENNILKDRVKYDLCKSNNIEIIYYFPKYFLQFDYCGFYKDKLCCHNIRELKNLIDDFKINAIVYESLYLSYMPENDSSLW